MIRVGLAEAVARDGAATLAKAKIDRDLGDEHLDLVIEIRSALARYGKGLLQPGIRKKKLRYEPESDRWRR